MDATTAHSKHPSWVDSSWRWSSFDTTLLCFIRMATHSNVVCCRTICHSVDCVHGFLEKDTSVATIETNCQLCAMGCSRYCLFTTYSARSCSINGCICAQIRCALDCFDVCRYGLSNEVIFLYWRWSIVTQYLFTDATLLGKFTVVGLSVNRGSDVNRRRQCQ